MAFRLKCASFARLAVGVAVLAFPLLATGSAQAAIAGANPQTTTNRPDLVSATLNGSEVNYCFDKALAANIGPGQAANFTLDGYRATNVVPSSAATGIFPKVDQTNANCVIAYFDTSNGQDLNQFTIAGVNANTVTAQSSLQTNNADNTSLTGSTTHNGTTGLTTGPDLQNVVTDINTNTITFIEDQAVTTASAQANAAKFFFVDTAGHVCYAQNYLTINSDQTAVTYQFNKTSGECALAGPVTDAVRAGQEIGAVQAAADSTTPNTQGTPPAAGTGTYNTDDSVVVTGQSGTTTAPNLQPTTKLEADGSAIDFTFDQGVANAVASNFYAELSNGSEIPGTTATITGNTVRVTFTYAGFSLSQFDEYVVKAEVCGGNSTSTTCGTGQGAVTGQNAPNPPNIPASEPVGDNAGAFAKGFTTGPDAFGATLSKSSGVATVVVDQRAILGNGAGFFLLDQNGNVIGSAGSATFPTQGAGPQAVSVQFSPAQAAAAAAIEIVPDTMVTFGGLVNGTPGAGGNVQQILSPTVTASVLSRAHYKSHAVSSRTRKAQRARALRRSEAAARRFLRTHHSHKK